jgi:hypothetical protein
MREALEAWFGILIGLLLIGTLFSGIFIWLAVKTARIRNLRLKTIMIAAFSTSVLATFGTFIISGLPFLGAIPSYLIALLSTFSPIIKILKVKRNQFLWIWGLNGAAQILALILGAVLFMGGFGDLLGTV